MSESLNVNDLDTILLYLEGCSDTRSESLCALIEKVQDQLAEKVRAERESTSELDSLIDTLKALHVDPYGVELTVVLGRVESLVRRTRKLAVLDRLMEEVARWR